MEPITIAVDSDFRFDLALRYLQRSDDEVIDQVRDGCHFRVIDGFDTPALIEISATQPGSLQARVVAGESNAGTVQSAVRRLYPADSGGFSAEITREPLARKLYEDFKGLPVVQTLTPWEALVWAILGQQINIAFAYRLKRAFVETFGFQMLYDERSFYEFPTPDRVASLDHEQDLLPLQFSRQKSRYIIEAARAVVAGTLDFDAVAELPDDEAVDALQRQLGVGRWTAEYVLLRGYGRLDVIPAGDAALKMAVGKHLGLSGPATEADVRELAEHWKPRRGKTAFMLWFAKQFGWF